MAAAVETMAYSGEAPWHRLGTKVSNDLDPYQMMKKAGLDWEVKKYSASVRVGDKTIRTGQKALVRLSDNRVLTNVGENWNPVQNETAFKFFHEFVLAGDMEMHTAGSLLDGRQVWVLAKVKESFDIFGGDEIHSYLLFSNPHQYGKSINVRFTPIRVVCNNTLTLSLGTHAERQFSMGHRAVFNPNIVKETLGLAHTKFSKYKEMAEFLGSKRVTGDSLIEYFNSVFPRSSSKTSDGKPLSYETLSRNAKQAFDILETQPGAEYAPGTFWQAFNATTFITDHVQGRSKENRLNSAWFGSNVNRKQAAANIATEMANAA